MPPRKKETAAGPTLDLVTESVTTTLPALVIPESQEGLALVTDEDLLRQRATELAEAYKDYTVDSIRNLGDYEVLKADHNGLIKLRTSLDKRRLQINRNTNAFADGIAALFAPTEKRLKAVRDEYEKAKAEKKAAAEKARAELINGRKQELFALSVVWTGSFYQLGLSTAVPADLEDDALWDLKLSEFREEAQRIKDQAERDRLERQRKELELEQMRQKAEELRLQLEERDRKDAEEKRKAEQAERDREAEAQKSAALLEAEQAKTRAAEEGAMLAVRKAQLMELGGVPQWEDANGVVVPAKQGIYGVRLGGLFLMKNHLLVSAEEWEQMLEDCRGEVERAGLASKAEATQAKVQEIREETFQNMEAERKGQQPKLPLEVYDLSDPRLDGMSFYSGARHALKRVKLALENGEQVNYLAILEDIKDILKL